MNLKQIEIFLELSKELHFWRTAEKVHLTQSALSRQIQALEEELGFLLFTRNKQSVKLTKAGDFMRGEWQRMIEEIRHVHRQAKQISQGEIGTIRIGHPGSITYSLLPDLLAETSNVYPDLKFELIEISTIDVEQALLGYKIDVSFDRELPQNEHLTFKILSQDNFALFVPEHHHLQSENFTDLRDVREEKFILPSVSQYTEDLKDVFRAYDFTPQTYIESDFGATILSLVARGMGITVLPASYSRQLPKGVRFINLPERTNLYSIWRKYDDNAILQNLLALLRIR